MCCSSSLVSDSTNSIQSASVSVSLPELKPPQAAIDAILAAYLKPCCNEWYKITVALDPREVDPFFTTVAALLPTRRLSLGGGADIVQLVLGLAKNLQNPASEVNQLVLPDPDPLNGWLNFRDIFVPAFKARPAATVLGLDLNPESSYDLEIQVNNYCSGLALTSGRSSLMVPIKHCCLAQIPAEGTAQLYFRTRKDFIDYANRHLTLPDVDKLTAAAWLASISNPVEREDALWQCLQYNFVVYARAKPLGWSFETSSQEFLKDLVLFATASERQEAIEHAKIMLSGPESRGHVLAEVLREFGLTY